MPVSSEAVKTRIQELLVGESWRACKTLLKEVVSIQQTLKAPVGPDSASSHSHVLARAESCFQTFFSLMGSVPREQAAPVLVDFARILGRSQDQLVQLYQRMLARHPQ